MKSMNEECCNQQGHVTFKGTITKLPVHKQTHRTTQKQVKHQEETDIQKKLFFKIRVSLHVQDRQHLGLNRTFIVQ